MALKSYVGNFALNTGTGNQAVTGIGFVPKAILFFSNALTADGSSVNADSCHGIATSSTSRAVVAGAETDAAGTTDGESYHSNAACLLAINVAGTPIMVADFVSMDSNGFTINITTSDAVARVVNYIALGGSDLTNATVLQWTTALVTGNQAMTGVGFKPDCIFNVGSLNSTLPPAARASIFHNIGIAKSSTSRAESSWKQGATVSTTVTERTQETNQFIESSNVTLFFVADFVSMDTDGFTINWSTANGTARYQYALCLKGGLYQIGSFNQATGTGNQSTARVNFQPSCIYFQSVNATTATGVQANARISNGAATSSYARFNMWHGSLSGNVGSVVDKNLDRTAAIKMMTEGTPTTDAVADFVTFNSDGFTLNWTTADATAREILYLAFGSSNTGKVPPTKIRPKPFVPGLSR